MCLIRTDRNHFSCPNEVTRFKGFENKIPHTTKSCNNNYIQLGILELKIEKKNVHFSFGQRPKFRPKYEGWKSLLFELSYMNSFGHGDRDLRFKLLNNSSANISGNSIKLFLLLCEQ